MKWKIGDYDEKLIYDLRKKIGLSKIIAQIIYNRGIRSDEDINNFLEPDILKMRDPFLLDEMTEAVKKVLEVYKRKEKIIIYGDYDVDGITAAAFLTLVFKNIGINVDYYIPNRMEEGYGLNKKAIKEIKNREGKLIITVDVGINSNAEIKYAKDLGIGIIITDHHKILTDQEEDIIVVNPKSSKNYGFEFLSGAGVALKLAEAIYKKLNLNLDDLYQYLDIVMLGTVADVVPMVDENRIIIKKGLDLLKETKIKGFVYLMKYLKLQNKEITTTDVSFFISPMLNALGRIGSSDVGVEFFLEEDDFKIYNIIEEMKKANKIRRSLERTIFKEVTEILGDKVDEFKYIFLKSDKWHPGVIGVVSARLALKYNIPVLLISIRNGVGKASCRSINGINIFDILKEVSYKFIRFGGHDLAAGFVAKREDLEEIEELIEISINKNVHKKIEKEVFIDSRLELSDIDDKFMRNLKKLSPFGLKNSQPLFLTENVYFLNYKKFGVEDRHFKSYVKKGEVIYSAVGFNLGHKLDAILSEAQVFNVVYYPEIVNIRGEETVQLKIKDFKVVNEFGEIFN